MRHIAFAVLLFAGIAYAETPQDKARVLFTEGERAFAKGDFAIAAKRFDDAYRLDADPSYLYNSARAHLSAEQCAIAVERYRELLKTADLQAGQRRDVNEQRAQADACAKKQAEPEPVVEQPERTSPVEEPESKRGRRIAGLAIAGVGLVAVGVGIYYTFDVKSLQEDRDAVCPSGCTWDDTKDKLADAIEADGARSEKIAVGSYIAGGLALGGGIALYLMSKDEAPRSLAIAPTANGAVVFGRF